MSAAVAVVMLSAAVVVEEIDVVDIVLFDLLRSCNVELIFITFKGESRKYFKPGG